MSTRIRLQIFHVSVAIEKKMLVTRVIVHRYLDQVKEKSHNVIVI